MRLAQLYQLYLQPPNSLLLHHLYITPCSSNPLVQMTIAHQLRRAAQTEIIKSSTSNTISEAEIMTDAADAFSALSTLLGEDGMFYGVESPGSFDASVFAYTHLILADSMSWEENQLKTMLEKHVNLIKHRDKILEMYF